MLVRYPASLGHFSERAAIIVDLSEGLEVRIGLAKEHKPRVVAPMGKGVMQGSVLADLKRFEAQVRRLID